MRARLTRFETTALDWRWITRTKPSYNWRIQLIAILIALGIHAIFHLNLLVCLAIVVVAMLVNGIVAEIEDRRPGGFLNPKPEADTH